MSDDEVVFAQGNEIETQNIRVTYKTLQLSRPDKKFPRIYKGEECIGLTPAEGRYLAEVLTELCEVAPPSQKEKP